MKILVSCDSEGEACLTGEKDPVTVYGTWQAGWIRRQATAEIAAAVEAAKEAGADEILVHDGGYIRGATPPIFVLQYEYLPQGIQIAMGGVPFNSVLDRSFDGALMIGRHAMAGVVDGVMAHTYSAADIQDMWLNGRRIGEIGINAIQLGRYGIPIIMLSADEAGCREALEWLGDVELAPVKRGFSRHSAVSMQPDDACDLIRAKVKAAMSRIRDFKPYVLPPPYELRVDCYTEEMARFRAQRPGATLVGPRSFLIRTDNPADFTRQQTAT